MSELAEAIRAWEAACDVTKGARKALHEAFAVLDATGSRDATIAWDAARKAVFEARARQEESERAALRLMPWGVPDGAEMPVDGASGCVVDGRFFYQLDGEIHWMKVAAPSLPPVAIGCDPVAEDVCPDCGREGLDYGVFNMVEGGDVEQDMTCRNCGGRWTDRFSRVGRRPLLSDSSEESPKSTKPEEPDGDWKRCDMTCPGCKEDGHVFYRIWESPWDAYKDMRYECRNCGDAWPVGRGGP